MHIELGESMVIAKIHGLLRYIFGKRPDSFPLEHRRYWVESLTKIAEPVLTSLSRRELKKCLPMTIHPKRANSALLEAFGRLACGLAPWLEASDLEIKENTQREKYGQLMLEGLDAATDPQSLDYMNFGQDGSSQPL